MAHASLSINVERGNEICMMKLPAKYGKPHWNAIKMGMFHYQVLINAKLLEDVNPIDFCRAVGVPDSYTVEFQKMLRVAKTIKEHGKSITADEDN